ncbi:hypothetical protein A7U60_g4744 [Sanghuangporus baumii]|uniref:Uncharacterized protein n=1 Tax=Sanghuangporus baumii TaxID=108892 RepID=A0A9Q5HYM3_SANBA|nr:hypothetical protein A7U60_g4744 [Sanghuangporus baumii]
MIYFSCFSAPHSLNIIQPSADTNVAIPGIQQAVEMTAVLYVSVANIRVTSATIDNANAIAAKADGRKIAQ